MVDLGSTEGKCAQCKLKDAMAYTSHMPLHVTVKEPNTGVVSPEADHRVPTRRSDPCITSHRRCKHTSAGIAEPERRGIVVGIHDSLRKARMDVVL